jgi:hypothetical protein
MSNTLCATESLDRVCRAYTAGLSFYGSALQNSGSGRAFHITSGPPLAWFPLRPRSAGSESIPKLVETEVTPPPQAAV